MYNFLSLTTCNFCLFNRSLLVHIYAVKNDETNEHKNIHIDKVFLTNGEFISNLKLDQNERPTVDVNGKML